MTWPPPELSQRPAQRGLRHLVHGGQAYVHVDDLATWMEVNMHDRNGMVKISVMNAIRVITAEMRRMAREAVRKKGQEQPPS